MAKRRTFSRQKRTRLGTLTVNLNGESNDNWTMSVNTCQNMSCSLHGGALKGAVWFGVFIDVSSLLTIDPGVNPFFDLLIWQTMHLLISIWL